MKYLKVLCFTTVLSLSISLVPMTFVSAQSLDAVIASNEISHSDEQIEPHLVGEDSRGIVSSEAGNLGSVSSSLEDTRGNLGSVSSSSEDSRGSEAGMSGMETDEQMVNSSVSSGQQSGTDGQMVVEAGVSGMESGGSDEQLVTEIQPQEDSVVVSSGLGNGGLSGQGQTTSGGLDSSSSTTPPISSSPMSAEEFSSLISSSSVTPDTTSRLSTTVTSLIKRAASTITTLLCVFITAFLTVRVLLDLMFIALPFTESIATKFGLSGSEPQSTLGPQGALGMSNSLPGGNKMSLSPQPQSPYPSSPSSSSRKFTLVSEEVLRARQSPHPLKTYCHDAIIILTVTPMLLVLTVSGVFNHLGLLFGDVIVSLLNNLGGIL